MIADYDVRAQAVMPTGGIVAGFAFATFALAAPMLQSAQLLSSTYPQVSLSPHGHLPFTFSQEKKKK